MKTRVEREMKKGARHRITKLLVADEAGNQREVTNPEEINRFLRQDGFTVDEFGNVGLSDRLKFKQ
jgi:hypothetical protein